MSDVWPDTEIYSIRNQPGGYRSEPWIQYAGQTGGAHFYRSERAARKAAWTQDAVILKGTISWEEVADDA